MTRLRELVEEWRYKLNVRSFGDVRENKFIMGGLAAVLGLIAVAVLARGLLGGGASPDVPDDVHAASAALIEELQAQQPVVLEAEAPMPERGSGRMPVAPP